mmetsp:Transcript_29188/g.63350  ORF Transcript_29188/g.63350 Transcript_29188/m.63350 type:complete len:86 (-) Transcript_29188:933-1190(-)
MLNKQMSTCSSAALLLYASVFVGNLQIRNVVVGLWYIHLITTITIIFCPYEYLLVARHCSSTVTSNQQASTSIHPHPILPSKSPI